MATSRRNFLKTGTMGLLCAGLPVGLAKAVVGRPKPDGRFGDGNATGAGHFTRDAFAPYVGTRFRVKADSGSVDLRLTKITSRIAGRESFSLLFAGSSNSQLLTQETRPIEHRELGRFSLFLVPVGKPTSRHYEAIIVRL